MIVVDELDRLKDTGQGQVRTRARMTLGTGCNSTRYNTAPTRQDGPLRTSCLTLQAATSATHRVDDEIVRRLTSLRDSTCRNVILVTYDVGMSLRARIAGLTPLLLSRPASESNSQSKR